MILSTFEFYNQGLSNLPLCKLLITTLNANCYNIAQLDLFYKNALVNSDIIIPDGISVIWAVRFLTSQKLQKIAGADLFMYEMERLQQIGGKCFFLGSTDNTLTQIKEKINREYPKIIVDSYSPPFKTEFSEEDDLTMLKLINTFQPDVLMLGMTAPKQEKWAYKHYNDLKVGHICCIGAVFDFYSGNINRAPKWMINYGLEWFYRLIQEPRRMWRRYLIGNTKFIWAVLVEKIKRINGTTTMGVPI